MRNKKLLVLMVVILLASLLLTACQPGGGAEDSGKKRVVFLTEDPVGVNPYFISGLDGLERAKNELDVETKVIEGTSDPTTTEENLRAAVREKYDLYIVMTFGFEDVLNEVAPENPDLFFVCIDCAVDQPNVLNIGFKSHESAYLLGIAAGLLTETPRCDRIADVVGGRLGRSRDSERAGDHTRQPGCGCDKRCCCGW
jgi:basic membrane protein A